MLVWIDLEMTGLNPEQEKIVEIAVILTDFRFYGFLVQKTPWRFWLIR